MSMQIEWIGLAEASVEDGRGVVALIGVQQNVVAAASLPIRDLKRVVPVFISDSDASSPVLVEGVGVTIRVTVESPTGDVLLFARQTSTLGPPKWRGIPTSLHIFVEMQLEITEYGTHTIRVEAETSEGEMVTGTKELYVMAPDQRIRPGTDAGVSESDE